MDPIKSFLTYLPENLFNVLTYKVGQFSPQSVALE